MRFCGWVATPTIRTTPKSRRRWIVFGVEAGLTTEQCHLVLDVFEAPSNGT
jgi:hypothetical protein